MTIKSVSVYFQTKSFLTCNADIATRKQCTISIPTMGIYIMEQQIFLDSLQSINLKFHKSVKEMKFQYSMIHKSI